MVHPDGPHLVRRGIDLRNTLYFASWHLQIVVMDILWDELRKEGFVVLMCGVSETPAEKISCHVSNYHAKCVVKRYTLEFGFSKNLPT